MALFSLCNKEIYTYIHLAVLYKLIFYELLLACQNHDPD